MQTIFNINMSDVYQSDKLKVHDNIEELYSSIRNYQGKTNTFNTNLNVQHYSLVPQLRSYQQDAVKWMIHKENNKKCLDILNPLYEVIKLNSGKEIYYNKYSGFIETTLPIVQNSESGGILADEMGLGKTVEVLACILNNKRDLPEPTDDIIKENDNDSDVDDLNCDNGNATGTQQNILVNNNDNDDGDAPTIATQVKCKRPKLSSNVTAEKNNSASSSTTTSSQKLSRLSDAKRAAQIWYENKLSEMVIKKRNKNNNKSDQVQCICGDFSRNNLVRCKECKKIQHANCMNYKRERCKVPYYCPQCWSNRPLVKSTATLIVSPHTIYKQWTDEVRRHIRDGTIKVLEYNGIHQAGMIYPTDLAKYDLVVTTYNVLQSEFKFASDEVTTKSLRYAKRYNVPSTPLLCIEWWRLCLDEAQNVDCPTNLVSCMAKQLHAVHRWAITGTPIQKHIIDMFGLCDYLQVAPYDDEDIWNHKLYYPYLNGLKEPMIEFLANILRRTAKMDVLDQINLPEQKFQEHWLKFSAVEKFYYDREHETCAQDFLAKLRSCKSLNVALKDIDRHTLNSILKPLLSLRQACTHPHAVRGRYLASRKQINSMEDLLDALLKKSTADCTESVRAVIAALNGQGGILLLQNRYNDAADKYRSALTYMGQNENRCGIQIDRLQRIHTLHNLDETLKVFHLLIPPTVRDHQLRGECNTHQRIYMEKYVCDTRTALKDVANLQEYIKQMRDKMNGPEGAWCAALIEWCEDRNLDADLLQRLTAYETETQQYEAYIAKRKQYNLNDTRQLLYMITTWVDKAAMHLNKIYEMVQSFEETFQVNENNYLSEELVREAADCHLRPEVEFDALRSKRKSKKQNYCLCCTLKTQLKKYETIIFQMTTKKDEQHANYGNWQPSFEENLLKVIYSYCKTRGPKAELLADGELHLKLAEYRRKELKELGKLFTHFDKQLAAQDELDMCKVRFRLRIEPGSTEDYTSPRLTSIQQHMLKKRRNELKNLDYNIENKFQYINILTEQELEYNYFLFDCEIRNNVERLNKLLGTHSYLETLKKQQYEGQDPDPCPICKTQLTDTWSILHCGHCYCLNCISLLLEQGGPHSNSITCSICRKKQKLSDVSYIKMKLKEQGDGNNDDDNNREGGGDDDDDDEEIEVKGSYSEKVHAIVECVLHLRKSDSTVKVLIFSTWIAVLKVLQTAFNTNNIGVELITSTSNIQQKLHRFKTCETTTALLMPVRLGANGLNLIEATHIILVEPLMNPGEELQAIGRIHRIGQTKPTFVHRFLIKSTIEESIYKAISTNAQQWDNDTLSLIQLKNLFVNDIETNQPNNDESVHSELDETANEEDEEEQIESADEEGEDNDDSETENMNLYQSNESDQSEVEASSQLQIFEEDEDVNQSVVQLK